MIVGAQPGFFLLVPVESKSPTFIREPIVAWKCAEGRRWATPVCTVHMGERDRWHAILRPDGSVYDRNADLVFQSQHAYEQSLTKEVK